ncbi:MAG TPA: L-threonylcarbamoyladenylate synthase, partial [Usitatibacter sp.]|nr:L-threonylcarbamoyladenylate synthase [Usitatibacter sp.]
MSRIVEAAARLLAGDLVAFPTETVYGLGADAANAAAVAKIFALKERPADHPLIVHFASPAALDVWAVDVPQGARKLAARFWPGPLTMILGKAARLPSAVTGGQDSVGLRCPSHPMAQALLGEFARIGSGAVAAPSANKFGHVSPTTAEHVREEFGSGLLVLDGGPCEVGLESTIVDLTRGVAVLLRPGGISRQAIAEALGEPLHDRDAAAPRASGMLAAHYAPRTALALVDFETLAAEIRAPSNVAVLALQEPPRDARVTSWITAGSTPASYGH